MNEEKQIGKKKTFLIKTLKKSFKTILFLSDVNITNETRKKNFFLFSIANSS